MKLYEVPPQSYIKLVPDGDLFFFDHVDGMYSLCYDKDKNRLHLSASTEIVQHYKNNKNSS